LEFGSDELIPIVDSDARRGFLRFGKRCVAGAFAETWIIYQTGRMLSGHEPERDQVVRDVEPLTRVELRQNILVTGARRIPVARQTVNGLTANLFTGHRQVWRAAVLIMRIGCGSVEGCRVRDFAITSEVFAVDFG
jgi:hypothetical protein